MSEPSPTTTRGSSAAPDVRPHDASAPSAISGQAASAQVAPQSRLDRALAIVPRLLSSHAHIIFLGCLGVYLVVLPLLGISVSAKAELIGGNYTNVTSDLGACIAAGLTVHLVRREHTRANEARELLRSLHARHDLLVKAVEDARAASQRAETAVRAIGRG